MLICCQCIYVFVCFIHLELPILGPRFKTTRCLKGDSAFPPSEAEQMKTKNPWRNYLLVVSLQPWDPWTLFIKEGHKSINVKFSSQRNLRILRMFLLLRSHVNICSTQFVTLISRLKPKTFFVVSNSFLSLTPFLAVAK